MEMEKIMTMSQNTKENITLIGMPGAGKSTVGVVLAKMIGYRFIDADLEIQQQTGKLLYELISEYGSDGFLKIEDKVCAGLQPHRAVIATGGSAVYGAEGMAHLKDISTVVYLRLSHENLKRRLGDLNKRGVVLRPGQTLKDLLEERRPYYETYADITIDADRMEIREVVEAIRKAVAKTC